MQSLFDFFYKYRILSTFIVMEFFCIWLIVSNNIYQSASFFNSSNYVVGSFLEQSSRVSAYFNLSVVNDQLTEENRRLKEELQKLKLQSQLLSENKSLPNLDSAKLQQFKFESAHVINSTVNKTSNFFTINKGSASGIESGMGVISTNGVAGKVKYCSSNFSTVVSVLNQRWEVPAKIKRSNVMGFAKWSGVNPYEVSLEHIGKHHKVLVGDTIITSGYSASFPEGISIGKVSSVVDDGKKYIIKVKLDTDFTAMSTVYVITNTMKNERDSLEAQVKMNTPQ